MADVALCAANTNKQPGSYLQKFVFLQIFLNTFFDKKKRKHKIELKFRKLGYSCC